MASDLFAALALVLVIEGVLPFVAPRLWRDMFRQVTELSEQQIRFVGLASMLAGVVVLVLSK